MRPAPLSLALALVACAEPAPTDLGGPAADDTDAAGDGDSDDLPPAAPGMLVDQDSVQSRFGLDLSIAPDGTMYVSGHERVADEPNAPMWLAHFDAEGTLAWERAIDGVSGGAYVSAAAHGVYVSVNGQDEQRLERRSSDGEIVWSTTELTWATAALDGGFFTTDRDGQGTWLRKLDADRVEQWSTFFGGENEEITTFIADIEVAQDGRIWLLGVEHDDATPDPVWVVLLDGDGVVQWEPHTFTDATELKRRVDATDAGAVVLGGAMSRTWGFANDGTHEWTYDLAAIPNAYAAVASGGFVAANWVLLPEGDPTCQHTFSECPTHIEVRRVDGNEAVVWEATTDIVNWVMDAKIAPDGTVVLLGVHVDHVTGAPTTVLLRYGV